MQRAAQVAEENKAGQVALERCVRCASLIHSCAC